MNPLRKFAQLLRRWIAKSIETPSQYTRSVWAATLTVAETLLELVQSGMVPDLARIKEANIRAIEAQTEKREAETQVKKAEAQLALTEAVDAANRAALHKRHDAIARAEKARLAAEAAKTQAEADAIRMDAETRRLQAVAEARTNLLNALAQLRSEGGELFVNRKNLEELLQLRMTHLTDDLHDSTDDLHDLKPR